MSTSSTKTCVVPDCARKHSSHGYCSLHAARWRSGPLNPAWKGDDIGYLAAHDRVTALLGKAADYQCANCGQAARDWSYDGLDPVERVGTGQNTGRRYSPSPAFYRPLCRRCNLAEGRRWQRV